MTVSETGLVRLLVVFAAAAAGCGSDQHLEGDHDDHEESPAVADHVEIDTTLIAKGLIATDTVIAMYTGTLNAVGEITWLPDRVAMISAPVAGRLASVPVAPGSAVSAGELLATMQSPEVAALQVEYREASVLGSIARQHYERQVRLEREGVVARRSVLEAEGELRRHELAAEGLIARLGIVGADTAGGAIRITSPITGVLLARTATPGQMVTPDMLLFTVAELSTVMLEVAVAERDLTLVKRGMEATAAVAAWPGRVFRGKVSEVSGGVDAVTRSVVARIEIPNRDLALRAGMHAAVELAGADSEKMLAVPAAAVQRIDGRQIVFVSGDGAGEYQVREVVAEPSSTTGWVIIRHGLEAGERLVTTGAFLLRSELSRGDLQGHDH